MGLCETFSSLDHWLKIILSFVEESKNDEFETPMVRPRDVGRAYLCNTALAVLTIH